MQVLNLKYGFHFTIGFDLKTASLAQIEMESPEQKKVAFVGIKKRP